MPRRSVRMENVTAAGMNMPQKGLNSGKESCIAGFFFYLNRKYLVTLTCESISYKTKNNDAHLFCSNVKSVSVFCTKKYERIVKTDYLQGKYEIVL